VSVSYIYDFCRRHTVNLRPGKGASTFLGPTARISKLEIKPDGTHPEYSLEQVVINTDSSKTWVQDHLHWPDNKPGAWHLPQDVDDDYCKQIVAESRVRLPSGKVEWVEHRPNNHYLDCEAMAFIAGYVLNVQYIPAGTVLPASASNGSNGQQRSRPHPQSQPQRERKIARATNIRAAFKL
ncbi:MAG: phage terminase large subunit family protein, partial [Anaerolineae bacterium]|nr:phage terminase large subunit family protein [Anaerolineae bacterium]